MTMSNPTNMMAVEAMAIGFMSHFSISPPYIIKKSAIRGGETLTTQEKL